MKRVIILGGGISGLVAAWQLRKSAKVTVLEKEARPGGYLRTIRKGKFLFEMGPRTCRTRGRGGATLALAEELGIADQVITPPAAANHRYLLIDGKLKRLNLATLMRCGLLSAIARDCVMKEPPDRESTIKAFALRHFGSTFTEQIIAPLVSGIYAGDIAQLSMRSCFPEILTLKERRGALLRMLWERSPVRGSAFVRQTQRSPLFSFQGGMETLTNTLAEQIDIRYQCAAETLTLEQKRSHVTTSCGKRFDADHIISALPAATLGTLLKKQHPTIAHQLQSFSSCPLVTLSLGYYGNHLPAAGFGYLVPSNAHEHYLGVVWDSCIFPQNNTGAMTRLSVMMGGVHHPNILNQSNEELITTGLNAVSRHLGIKATPDCWHLDRIERAIPQYGIGHQALVKRLQAALPGFTLLGCSFHGVAINDCVWNSRNVEELISSS